MEKTIRSYLNTLIVLFIFYFATRGIVKLFWNHKDLNVIRARTQLLFGVLFIGSLVYIIGIYHLVGGKYSIVNFFYKIYIIIAFIYIVVGILYDIVSSSKLKFKQQIKNINPH
jgi:hypothetical protein